MGFASLREKAQELGSNVASSVNDMNTKVNDAANKAAASTPTAAAGGGAPPATPGGGGGIAAASKEELVEVLQKMNKKVKALTVIRTQLQEKLQTTEQERDQLKAMVLNSSIMTKRPTPMERNEIMAASIQEISEIWKQMEAEDQKEFQQLKHALQNQPPSINGESASNNHANSDGGGDSALREDQLKQEHQRAMKELKETLTQQFQEEIASKDAKIAQLQQQQQQQQGSNGDNANTTTPTTPSGEGSTSEIDDLKKQHSVEVEKLKKAAALQLANFKKKVAAARSAELDKVKKETREQVEQEMQQNSDEVKANDPTPSAALDELKQQHAQELKSKLEEWQTWWRGGLCRVCRIAQHYRQVFNAPIWTCGCHCRRNGETPN